MLQQTPTTTQTGLDLSTPRKVATLQSDDNSPAEVSAQITLTGLVGTGMIQITEVELTSPTVTTISATIPLDGKTTLSFESSRKMAAAAADVEVYVEDLNDVSVSVKAVTDVFIELSANSTIVLDATTQLLMNWHRCDLMQLTDGETRVPGATLVVTANADGTGLMNRVVVNSNGEGVLFLPAGTYYRWGQHTTYKFVNPQVFTIPVP